MVLQRAQYDEWLEKKGDLTKGDGAADDEAAGAPPEAPPAPAARASAATGKRKGSTATGKRKVAKSQMSE